MIEEKEIKKLAELARIELTDDEAGSFKTEFEQILEYVSHLDAASATADGATAIEHRNVLRSDAAPHESGAYTRALVDVAPATEGDFITIGKVIKGAE